MKNIRRVCSLLLSLVLIITVLSISSSDVSAKSRSYQWVWQKHDDGLAIKSISESRANDRTCASLLEVADREIKAYMQHENAKIDSNSLSFDRWNSTTWYEKLRVKRSLRKKMKGKTYYCKINYAYNSRPGKTYEATVERKISYRKYKRYRRCKTVWEQTDEKLVGDTKGINKDIAEDLRNIALAEIYAYIEDADETPDVELNVIESYSVDISQKTYSKKNTRKVIYICDIDYGVDRDKAVPGCARIKLIRNYKKARQYYYIYK